MASEWLEAEGGLCRRGSVRNKGHSGREALTETLRLIREARSLVYKHSHCYRTLDRPECCFFFVEGVGSDWQVSKHAKTQNGHSRNDSWCLK